MFAGAFSPIMWAPEDADFSQEDTGLIFVLSAWHELFHGFTPDSHQPRLHNVASLVDELLDIGLRWKLESRFATHANKLKEELRLLIDAEVDILSLIPTYKSRLEQLAGSKTPEAVVAGASILSSYRSMYLLAFEEWARGAIEKLPSNKQEALCAIRRLATFAFQHGKEDDDVWKPSIAIDAKTPLEAFDQLLELTKAKEKTYCCTLSIIGDVDGPHSVARKQGYRVVSAKALPDEYLSSISAHGNNAIHIQLEVEALSIRAAVASARRKLGIGIGFVSLYRNPSELRIHPTASVTYQGESRVFLQSEQAFRRLYPRTHSKRDIDTAVQLVSTSKIDIRVLAAVEQLALASASTDTRTRFVNLWSALETLAGAHEGESTLERVCQLITPLVTSRKVHKITRYLTILCQRHAKVIKSEALGPGFTLRRGKIRIEDMLVSLSSPEDDPKIAGLLKFANHPLLRNHIYSTWKIFHKPRDLLQKICDSKQRLDWQLARIYRARNFLVHDGIEVPHIVPLLDNLQNYASMLVQRLVHELKENEHWTVRHAIEYWISRMTHVENSLKASPHCLTVGDFLETNETTKLWQRV